MGDISIERAIAIAKKSNYHSNIVELYTAQGHTSVYCNYCKKQNIVDGFNDGDDDICVACYDKLRADYPTETTPVEEAEETEPTDETEVD